MHLGGDNSPSRELNNPVETSTAQPLGEQPVPAVPRAGDNNRSLGESPYRVQKVQCKTCSSTTFDEFPKISRGISSLPNDGYASSSNLMEPKDDIGGSRYAKASRFLPLRTGRVVL